MAAAAPRGAWAQRTLDSCAAAANGSPYKSKTSSEQNRQLVAGKAPALARNMRGRVRACVRAGACARARASVSVRA